MEDLFAGFTEEWQWETIRATHDLCSSDEDEVEGTVTGNSSNKRKLSRKDIMCFGMTPTECKIYLECDKCHEILNPRRLLIHKYTLCKRRKDSSILTCHLPNTDILNRTDLNLHHIPSSSKSSLDSLKNSALDLKTITSSSPSSTSKTKKPNKTSDSYIGTRSAVALPQKNQHKKPSSTRQHPKERDIKQPQSLLKSSLPQNKSEEVFSESVSYVPIVSNLINGVVNKHKSQYKKPSSTRQQPKEKDSKPQSLLKSPITQNKSEEIFCENTSYVPIVRTIVNAVETSTTTITYVPIKLKTESDSTRHTTSINSSVPTTDRSINGTLKTEEKCFITTDTSKERPISVGKSISIVTIQSQSVFIPIPEPDTSDIKMYKTNPKPVAVPNFGLKKIDRAIILRLARQKSDILKALDTIRNTNNSNNNNNQAVDKQPQQNVLKLTNSVNCKRSAPDILSPSDNSKQRRLVENGFIFHSEKAPTVICPNI